MTKVGRNGPTFSPLRLYFLTYLYRKRMAIKSDVLRSGACVPEEESILRRLVRDESGQDLIEYALLSLFIGVCAVLAVVKTPPAIATASGNWNTNVHSISSSTPDPGGGGF